MDLGQPKVNRALLPRFCYPKFLHCPNFPLPTWWNLYHTGPQEMLLLWPRSPLFPCGNELQVTLHSSDSLCLHTGCFLQSCHFLAESPFFLFSTSLPLALKHSSFEKPSFTSAFDIVRPVLNVCLSAYSSRGHGGVCVISLWANTVHCSHQMLHTVFYL